MKKNVVLVFGGGSSEHEISKVSASYLKSTINKDDFNILQIEISKDFEWFEGSKQVELNFDGKLVYHDGKRIKVDYLLPCIHGYPGETGDLQSYLEMIKIKFLGNKSEASKICFNKILTKLWLDKIGVPTTDFITLNSLTDESVKSVKDFLNKHSKIFIKASSQGSSVGCYPLSDETKIHEVLKKAFEFSDFVLVEKNVVARELEVATFEYKGKLHITNPGEIVSPDSFYSFEEKYDSKSKTVTHVEAKDLTSNDIEKIKEFAKIAFTSLKLRDLSRIDFFLTSDGEILLNEINTFPGLTPISMFPKMMENYGVQFKDYIADRIDQSL